MASQSQRDTSAIDGRAVAVGALAVLLLISMATALVRLLATRGGTTTSATTSTAVRAPPLSSSDAAHQLQVYQATEAAWLQSYGWRDRAQGIAHIPIQRAMQLLLQHPQLARPKMPPPAAPSVGKPSPVEVPRPPDEPQPLAVPP